MPSLYIASSLQNWERVKRLQQEFINRGVEITYDWTPCALVHKEVGEDDQYEKDLAEYATKEFNGVLAADHMLVVMPGGRGTHFEMGVMAAFSLVAGDDTPVITVLCDEDNTKLPTSFHYLPLVARIASESDAIDHVMSCLAQ